MTTEKEKENARKDHEAREHIQKIPCQAQKQSHPRESRKTTI